MADNELPGGAYRVGDLTVTRFGFGTSTRLTSTART
jgi:hypothetical protein